MTANADHIQSAIQALGFRTERFGRLPTEQAERVYKSALRHFVQKGDPRWWWEHFSKGISVQFIDDTGWQSITQIVPDADEPVWFIVEDFVPPEYSVWNASSQDIQSVIAECPFFEFYIIQKDFRWLVCENHHGVVFAVGNEVEERLGELSNNV